MNRKNPSSRFRAPWLRLLSLTLALILGAESFLAPLAHASIWEERQKAIQAQEPQLASLPAVSLPPIPSSFHTKDFSKYDPFIQAAKSNASILKQLIHAVETGPGKIQSIRFPEKEPQGFLVILQDVHGNQEAQRHLGQLSQNIFQTGLTKTLWVEGASEDINLTPFQTYPNKKAIQSVATYLLKENRISGPVYEGLLSLEPVEIKGAENPRLYTLNVEAARRLGRGDHQSVSLIQEERDAWQKNQNLSEPILTLFTLMEKRRMGKEGLGEVVSNLLLLSKRAIPAKNYPDMEGLAEASALEAQLNHDRVEIERRRLLGRLIPRLDKRATNELSNQASLYRLKRITHGEFFAFLEKTTSEAGINLSQFPSLPSYFRYVTSTEAIDYQRLNQEINQLEEDLLDLAASSQERKMYWSGQSLVLAHKLAKAELTSSEWTLLSKNLKVIPRRLTKSLQPFIDFYLAARERDEALSEPVLGKNKVSALVVGGFHTKGISENALKKNWAVISVQPNLSQGEQSENYLSVFAREKAPLDQLFRGEKLFLTDHPGQLALGGPLVSLYEEAANGPQPFQKTAQVLSHFGFSQPSAYKTKDQPPLLSFLKGPRHSLQASFSSTFEFLSVTIRRGPIPWTTFWAHRFLFLGVTAQITFLSMEIYRFWRGTPFSNPILLGLIPFGFIEGPRGEEQNKSEKSGSEPKQTNFIGDKQSEAEKKPTPQSETSKKKSTPSINRASAKPESNNSFDNHPALDLALSFEEYKNALQLKNFTHRLPYEAGDMANYLKKSNTISGTPASENEYDYERVYQVMVKALGAPKNPRSQKPRYYGDTLKEIIDLMIEKAPWVFSRPDQNLPTIRDFLRIKFEKQPHHLVPFFEVFLNQNAEIKREINFWDFDGLREFRDQFHDFWDVWYHHSQSGPRKLSNLLKLSGQKRRKGRGRSFFNIEAKPLNKRPQIAWTFIELALTMKIDGNLFPTVFEDFREFLKTSTGRVFVAYVYYNLTGEPGGKIPEELAKIDAYFEARKEEIKQHGFNLEPLQYQNKDHVHRDKDLPRSVNDAVEDYYSNNKGAENKNEMGGILRSLKKAILSKVIPQKQNDQQVTALYNVGVAPALENLLVGILFLILTGTFNLSPEQNFLAWTFFVSLHLAEAWQDQEIDDNKRFNNLFAASFIALANSLLGFTPISFEGWTIHAFVNFTSLILPNLWSQLAPIFYFSQKDHGPSIPLANPNYLNLSRLKAAGFPRDPKSNPNQHAILFEGSIEDFLRTIPDKIEAENVHFLKSHFSPTFGGAYDTARGKAMRALAQATGKPGYALFFRVFLQNWQEDAYQRFTRQIVEYLEKNGSDLLDAILIDLAQRPVDFDLRVPHEEGGFQILTERAGENKLENFFEIILLMGNLTPNEWRQQILTLIEQGLDGDFGFLNSFRPSELIPFYPLKKREDDGTKTLRHLLRYLGERKELSRKDYYFAFAALEESLPYIKKDFDPFYRVFVSRLVELKKEIPELTRQDFNNLAFVYFFRRQIQADKTKFNRLKKVSLDPQHEDLNPLINKPWPFTPKDAGLFRQALEANVDGAFILKEMAKRKLIERKEFDEFLKILRTKDATHLNQVDQNLLGRYVLTLFLLGREEYEEDIQRFYLSGNLTFDEYLSYAIWNFFPEIGENFTDEENKKKSGLFLKRNLKAFLIEIYEAFKPLIEELAPLGKKPFLLRFTFYKPESKFEDFLEDGSLKPFLERVILSEKIALQTEQPLSRAEDRHYLRLLLYGGMSEMFPEELIERARKHFVPFIQFVSKWKSSLSSSSEPVSWLPGNNQILKSIDRALREKSPIGEIFYSVIEPFRDLLFFDEKRQHFLFDFGSEGDAISNFFTRISWPIKNDEPNRDINLSAARFLRLVGGPMAEEVISKRINVLRERLWADKSPELIEADQKELDALLNLGEEEESEIRSRTLTRNKDYSNLPIFDWPDAPEELRSPADWANVDWFFNLTPNQKNQLLTGIIEPTPGEKEPASKQGILGLVEAYRTQVYSLDPYELEKFYHQFKGEFQNLFQAFFEKDFANGPLVWTRPFIDKILTVASQDQVNPHKLAVKMFAFFQFILGMEKGNFKESEFKKLSATLYGTLDLLDKTQERLWHQKTREIFDLLAEPSRYLSDLYEQTVIPYRWTQKNLSLNSRSSEKVYFSFTSGELIYRTLNSQISGLPYKKAFQRLLEETRVLTYGTLFRLLPGNWPEEEFDRFTEGLLNHVKQRGDYEINQMAWTVGQDNSSQVFLRPELNGETLAFAQTPFDFSLIKFFFYFTLAAGSQTSHWEALFSDKKIEPADLAYLFNGPRQGAFWMNFSRLVSEGLIVKSDFPLIQKIWRLIPPYERKFLSAFDLSLLLEIIKSNRGLTKEQFNDLFAIASFSNRNSSVSNGTNDNLYYVFDNLQAGNIELTHLSLLREALDVRPESLKIFHEMGGKDLISINDLADFLRLMKGEREQQFETTLYSRFRVFEYLSDPSIELERKIIDDFSKGRLSARDFARYLLKTAPEDATSEDHLLPTLAEALEPVRESAPKGVQVFPVKLKAYLSPSPNPKTKNQKINASFIRAFSLSEQIMMELLAERKTRDQLDQTEQDILRRWIFNSLKGGQTPNQAKGIVKVRMIPLLLHFGTFRSSRGPTMGALDPAQVWLKNRSEALQEEFNAAYGHRYKGRFYQEILKPALDASKDANPSLSKVTDSLNASFEKARDYLLGSNPIAAGEGLAFLHQVGGPLAIFEIRQRLADLYAPIENESDEEKKTRAELGAHLIRILMSGPRESSGGVLASLRTAVLSFANPHLSSHPEMERTYNLFVAAPLENFLLGIIFYALAGTFSLSSDWNLLAWSLFLLLHLFEALSDSDSENNVLPAALISLFCLTMGFSPVSAQGLFIHQGVNLLWFIFNQNPYKELWQPVYRSQDKTKHLQQSDSLQLWLSKGRSKKSTNPSSLNIDEEQDPLAWRDHFEENPFESSALPSWTDLSWIQKLNPNQKRKLLEVLKPTADFLVQFFSEERPPRSAYFKTESHGDFSLFNELKKKISARDFPWARGFRQNLEALSQNQKNENIWETGIRLAGFLQTTAFLLESEGNQPTPKEVDAFIGSLVYAEQKIRAPVRKRLLSLASEYKTKLGPLFNSLDPSNFPTSKRSISDFLLLAPNQGLSKEAIHYLTDIYVTQTNPFSLAARSLFEKTGRPGLALIFSTLPGSLSASEAEEIEKGIDHLIQTNHGRRFLSASVKTVSKHFPSLELGKPPYSLRSFSQSPLDTLYLSLFFVRPSEATTRKIRKIEQLLSLKIINPSDLPYLIETPFQGLRRIGKWGIIIDKILLRKIKPSFLPTLSDLDHAIQATDYQWISLDRYLDLIEIFQGELFYKPNEIMPLLEIFKVEDQRLGEYREGGEPRLFGERISAYSQFISSLLTRKVRPENLSNLVESIKKNPDALLILIEGLNKNLLSLEDFNAYPILLAPDPKRDLKLPEKLLGRLYLVLFFISRRINDSFQGKTIEEYEDQVLRLREDGSIPDPLFIQYLVSEFSRDEVRTPYFAQIFFDWYMTNKKKRDVQSFKGFHLRLDRFLPKPKLLGPDAEDNFDLFLSRIRMAERIALRLESSLKEPVQKHYVRLLIYAALAYGRWKNPEDDIRRDFELKIIPTLKVLENFKTKLMKRMAQGTAKKGFDSWPTLAPENYFFSLIPGVKTMMAIEPFRFKRALAQEVLYQSLIDTAQEINLSSSRPPEFYFDQFVALKNVFETASVLLNKVSLTQKEVGIEFLALSQSPLAWHDLNFRWEELSETVLPELSQAKNWQALESAQEELKSLERGMIKFHQEWIPPAGALTSLRRFFLQAANPGAEASSELKKTYNLFVAPIFENFLLGVLFLGITGTLSLSLNLTQAAWGLFLIAHVIEAVYGGQEEERNIFAAFPIALLNGAYGFSPLSPPGILVHLAINFVWTFLFIPKSPQFARISNSSKQLQYPNPETPALPNRFFVKKKQLSLKAPNQNKPFTKRQALRHPIGKEIQELMDNKIVPSPYTDLQTLAEIWSEKPIVIGKILLALGFTWAEYNGKNYFFWPGVNPSPDFLPNSNRPVYLPPHEPVKDIEGKSALKELFLKNPSIKHKLENSLTQYTIEEFQALLSFIIKHPSTISLNRYLGFDASFRSQEPIQLDEDLKQIRLLEDSGAQKDGALKFSFSKPSRSIKIRIQRVKKVSGQPVVRFEKEYTALQLSKAVQRAIKSSKWAIRLSNLAPQSLKDSSPKANGKADSLFYSLLLRAFPEWTDRQQSAAFIIGWFFVLLVEAPGLYLLTFSNAFPVLALLFLSGHRILDGNLPKHVWGRRVGLLSLYFALSLIGPSWPALAAGVHVAYDGFIFLNKAALGREAAKRISQSAQAFHQDAAVTNEALAEILLKDIPISLGVNQPESFWRTALNQAETPRFVNKALSSALTETQSFQILNIVSGGLDKEAGWAQSNQAVVHIRHEKDLMAFEKVRAKRENAKFTLWMNAQTRDQLKSRISNTDNVYLYQDNLFEGSTLRGDLLAQNLPKGMGENLGDPLFIFFDPPEIVGLGSRNILRILVFDSLGEISFFATSQTLSVLKKIQTYLLVGRNA